MSGRLGSSGRKFRLMAAVIKPVTFDCADALALSRFWAAALGTDADENPTAERANVEAAGWAARTCRSSGCPRATRQSQK
jgi:hypothetical protein